jgi:hypothetical protein
VINWYSVIVNSFWIAGLSLLLAAFSYHYWLAQVTERPLRHQLNQVSFSRPFWLSFGLVGIGLAGTSLQTWETGLWSLFTLYCLYNLVYHFRHNPTGEQE